ncbi:MAG: DUF2384 domain-containing protein [Bacteroidetes bacterium]|nr:DUF2384 domain-containing protein [Bacteroidota bacterium]
MSYRIEDDEQMENIPSTVNESQVLYMVQGGGINHRFLHALKTYTSAQDDTLARWLNINVKTYRNYRDGLSALRPDTQEHTVLLISLVKHGLEVFGSKTDFMQWLGSPNPFFGGATPDSLLHTISGIRLIDHRLTAMEYGDNV